MTRRQVDKSSPEVLVEHMDTLVLGHGMRVAQALYESHLYLEKPETKICEVYMKSIEARLQQPSANRATLLHIGVQLTEWKRNYESNPANQLDVSNFKIDTHYWRRSLDDLIFLYELTLEVAIEMLQRKKNWSAELIKYRYQEHLKQVIKTNDPNFPYMNKLLERKDELLGPETTDKNNKLEHVEKKEVDLTNSNYTDEPPGEMTRGEKARAWKEDLAELVFKVGMPEKTAVEKVAKKYGMSANGIQVTWYSVRDEYRQARTQQNDDGLSKTPDVTNEEDSAECDSPSQPAVALPVTMPKAAVVNVPSALGNVFAELVSVVQQAQEEFSAIAKQVDVSSEVFKRKRIEYVDQIENLKAGLKTVYQLESDYKSSMNAGQISGTANGRTYRLAGNGEVLGVQ